MDGAEEGSPREGVLRSFRAAAGPVRHCAAEAAAEAAAEDDEDAEGRREWGGDSSVPTEVAGGGPARFAQGARPRNLRKKPAASTGGGGGNGGEGGEEEEEDLAAVREAIAAARLRETRRAAVPRSGSRGGGGGDWPNDGFVQWRATEPSASNHSHNAGSPLGSPARSPTRPVHDDELAAREDAAAAGAASAEVREETATAGHDLQAGLGLPDGAVPEWNRLDADMEARLKAMGLRAEMTAKGRALIAARPFKAGAIIVEQEPLAWAFFPHGQHASKWAEAGGGAPPDRKAAAPSGAAPVPINAQRCHYCLRTHATLRRCASCKYAHYCCVTHQKSDWPSHSTDCARRAKGNPARPPTAMVTMLSQLHDVRHAAERPKPPPPPPIGLSC